MAEQVRNLIAKWSAAWPSPLIISRQRDNGQFRVNLVDYPEPENYEDQSEEVLETISYYLTVWMKQTEDGEIEKLAPIQLPGPYWRVYSPYTQLVQCIRFQFFATSSVTGYIGHSAIFTGLVLDSLEEDGEDIGVIPAEMWDAYKQYIEDKIIAAGVATIDPTLSIQGAAADAKATGDAVAGLNGRLTSIEDMEARDLNLAQYAIGTLDTETGADVSSSTRVRSDYIDIHNVISVSFSVNTGYKFIYYLYDSSKAVIGHWGWFTTDTALTVPSNAYYMKMLIADTNNGTANLEYGNQVSVHGTTAVYTELSLLKIFGYKAYFSNGLYPTFKRSLSNANSTVEVTFPNAEFRLYRDDGSRLVATYSYANVSFTVNNIQKLVYDISSNTVSVVSTTAASNDSITLLEVLGNAISGCLSDFYNYYFDGYEKIINQLEAYLSNGQSPYFQVINVTSSATIKVLFPNAEFRLYGLTSVFYSSSALSGVEFTVNSLNKLVYDLKNNTVKVVGINASGEYIPLLVVMGQGLSGLLAKYYNANNDYYVRREQYDKLSADFNSTVKILFYSDVHGSEENVKRIINKAESYGVNAIVCGGDIVPFNIGQGLDWYNTLVASTSTDMLTCVGNHDVWSNADTQTLAAKADVYSAVIAPIVTKVSGIVQPQSASANKDLYYYKDYGNVRMIFLDAMLSTGGVAVGWWDSAQLNWFVSVLADARTNEKSVVCVVHPPFDKNIAIRDNDLPLNSWIDYRSYSLYEGIHLPTDAMDAVNTFINDGGDFICWLSGHTHIDSLLTATGYPGQVMINIMSARYNYHPDGTAWYLSTLSREKWYDSYDYIGFDTTNKMIKVVRIGYVQDGAMRKRERFCYDYANKKLLAYS